MLTPRTLVAVLCTVLSSPVPVPAILGPAPVTREPAAAEQSHFPDAVRVIVNPTTSVAAVSREQLSRVFLRKVARWEDGVPVLPVDLPESAPARDVFTRAVHHRSVGMITGYWQRQIFSGRQLPPPDRSSEADVVAYVRDTPGAIGYVSANTELRGVRIVSVTGE